MASIVFLRLNHYNGSKIATMFEEYASLTIHFRRTADRKNPWLWVVPHFLGGTRDLLPRSVARGLIHLTANVIGGLSANKPP